MLANYGYKDASGDFFITIDTEKCNGCGDCMRSCPATVLDVVGQDPYDPMREGPVAVVRGDRKKSIKYECGPCKAVGERPPLPCVKACKSGAILHSW